MRHESKRAAFEVACPQTGRVLYAAGSIAVTSLQPLDLPARQTKFEKKVAQDKFVLERKHGPHWVTKGVTQPATVEHALDLCRACPGVYRVMRQNKRGLWVEVRP